MRQVTRDQERITAILVQDAQQKLPDVPPHGLRLWTAEVEIAQVRQRNLPVAQRCPRFRHDGCGFWKVDKPSGFDRISRVFPNGSSIIPVFLSSLWIVLQTTSKHSQEKSN
jgi:hypothetical protein